MITIMNIILLCSTQLNYLNIILHVDKCVSSIPLISVPGHDLNSNASLNVDISLSLSFLL